MQDSFGDGWNGNNLIITNSDGLIVGSNTIEDENEILPTGLVIYIVFIENQLVN